MGCFASGGKDCQFVSCSFTIIVSVTHALLPLVCITDLARAVTVSETKKERELSLC